MSMPYGTSQPAVSHSAAGGLNLGVTLALAAVGLALVSYACSFSNDAEAFSLGIVLPLLVGGGLLAGATALPKAPNTLLVAAVLTATGALMLLLDVIRTEGDTKAIVIVILIASLLQTAALVVAMLLDVGVVKMRPKPAYGGPAWGPQSGGFPQQGSPYGQQPYGQQYGGAPQAPQAPQQTQQYGQHSSGQHSAQQGYGGQPGQSGQPPFGQQPYGQGQYGQSGQPHPGTPPGGFSGPGQS